MLQIDPFQDPSMAPCKQVRQRMKYFVELCLLPTYLAPSTKYIFYIVCTLAMICYATKIEALFLFAYFPFNLFAFYISQQHAHQNSKR